MRVQSDGFLFSRVPLGFPSIHISAVSYRTLATIKASLGRSTSLSLRPDLQYSLVEAGVLFRHNARSLSRVRGV